MASFQEFARKKVAGVPVIYLAGGFVVILAIIAYKMNPPTSGEESGPVDETDGSGPDQTGGAADYSGLATQGTVTVVQGSTSDAEVTKATNEDWGRSAVDYLIEANLATPSEAQSAIHKYLEGNDLTFEEGKLKDAAIRKLKLPPEPLVALGSIGLQPAQKQFSNFPGKHTVKGSNDNTPTKLANLYYGKSTSPYVLTISAANTTLGPASSNYTPGTVVNIPNYVTPRYFKTTPSTRSASRVAAANGISSATVRALNPNLTEPYALGKQIRIA
jgi:hypothetical protein